MSGLINAIGRGLSQAGYAAGDLYARQSMAEQAAGLQSERDARLMELQERSADRSRQAQMRRIDAAAGGIADAQLTGKTGLINAGITDKSSWTADQQAVVEQSLARDREALIQNPELRLRAAGRTGDIAPKDIAVLDREERRLDVTERSAAAKEAFEREREDRRDARTAAAEEGRDRRTEMMMTAAERRQAAMIDAADRRAQRSGENKVPAGYRLTKDGNLEFIPGGPADPNSKPAGGKPLNEGQAKALLFGTRMQSANEILDELEKKGRTISTPGANGFAAPVVNALNTKEGQMLDQAKRDFLNAVLRRESGAVIAETEFDNGNKQYFPQIGDSPEVIAQKRNNRMLAQRGILAEVPDGDSRVAKVRGDGQRPEAVAPAENSAPVRVNSMSDYKALPAGAQYVAPDGSLRRKQ